MGLESTLPIPQLISYVLPALLVIFAKFPVVIIASDLCMVSGLPHLLVGLAETLSSIVFY